MTDNEKAELMPDFLKPIVKMLLAKYNFEELPEKPEKGVWYKYHTEKAYCGNGEPYSACFKLGTENKLVIVFCGGGVSINEYTAAHPNNPLYPDPINFYADDVFMQAEIVAPHGLGSNTENNPFRNWNILVIPYATGDFHSGTNDLKYKTEKGEEKILHQRGYDNYRVLADKLKQFVPSPDKLLVTGFSAGGFATALLTDDIMDTFPGCKDVTCFPDAALLLYDGWHKSATECWKAPKPITDRLVTANLMLDSLKALYNRRGSSVKIIFASTPRDAMLAQYQHFVDKGEMRAADGDDGSLYTVNLKKFCHDLSEHIPDAGLFIYNEPFEGENPHKLTKHGLNMTDDVFRVTSDGVTCIDWIWNAVNGKTQKLGLSILEV